MTTRRIAHLISIAFVAAVLAGCGPTAPSRFYTLDSTATPGAAPVVHESVLVGPVSIPEAVDRPEIVIQAAPNRVDIEEFNRWAAPLNDGIARAVAGDLATLLGTPDVAVAPLGNFTPDYRVTIDVQRFEATVGQGVLVEAVWAVHKTDSGETRSGRTTARESAQGQGFDALAAAYSRTFAQVSGDIAGMIRSEAAEKP
ncbi:MAG: membrane integrity-associated transporter subunit PqiC [Candidatus Binataceae bacterium]